MLAALSGPVGTRSLGSPVELVTTLVIPLDYGIAIPRGGDLSPSMAQLG